MKIKKGDKVIVITGKDKGTTGTVGRAFPAENRVIVEGVNLRKKHQKGKRGGTGQIVEKPAPIHVSNVMLIDSKTGKGTRARAKSK